MKLDRNLNANKRGKYALLKLRKLDDFTSPGDPFQEVAEPVADAIDVLVKAGILDWGIEDTESEFFLIRLKDKYAQIALAHYANAARVDDPEYAAEIDAMAMRAGPSSPFCKKPD